MRSDFEAISQLGFGFMRLPLFNADDPTSVDVEQVKQMVDAFMEAGHTYFDTAYVYHNGISEEILRQALVERYPRESYTIATKCLAWVQPDAASAQACLDTSLKRLGVDYVDFYLLHNLGSHRTVKYDEYGMWDWIQAKKDEGVVKNIGFSLHDGPELLEELLTKHPNMDFVQLQVNYLDWENPVVQSRECMAIAEKHGVPVVIMEPARGGRLANLPARGAEMLTQVAPDKSQVSWAYRFCYNLPNVITVLSGMSSLEQVQENVREYREQTPFTPEEQEALSRTVEALQAVDTIPCTNCRYCVKDCPSGVKIPEILAILNLERIVEDHEFAKNQYSWQAANGLASSCIQCGACEDMCPQNIEIIDHLEEAADLYE